jgi:SAM-dependent methyltransferase
MIRSCIFCFISGSGLRQIWYSVTSDTMEDSKTRFSNRVDSYVKYRPHYPRELLEVLKVETDFTDQYTIADIGCGTGISSELFVQNGNKVFGVEPNPDMLAAAEREFSAFDNFIPVLASAEKSGLADSCADIIVSGQALHWFDQVLAAKEFTRVLKPDGWLVLFWNERKVDGYPFQEDYEKLLRDHCGEYGKVTQKNLDGSDIAQAFSGKPYQKRRLDNFQIFDFESLKGRLQSSSYSPDYDSPQYPGMINALEKIFKLHEKNGQVRFEYDTEIYFGSL